MFKNLSSAAIVAIALSMQIAPSNAVTVSFGKADVDPYLENGFSFNVARIVTGNCSLTPCMALNTNETSVLSRVGGGLFSLNSFWYKIFGGPATLVVKSFNGANIAEQFTFSGVVQGPNNGQTFNHLFNNVTSISFQNAGRGNVRIDDLNLSIPNSSVVPVPAALPLFLTGMAGLGLYGRRRRKAKHSI